VPAAHLPVCRGTGQTPRSKGVAALRHPGRTSGPARAGKQTSWNLAIGESATGRGQKGRTPQPAKAGTGYLAAMGEDGGGRRWMHSQVHADYTAAGGVAALDRPAVRAEFQPRRYSWQTWTRRVSASITRCLPGAFSVPRGVVTVRGRVHDMPMAANWLPALTTVADATGGARSAAMELLARREARRAESPRWSPRPVEMVSASSTANGELTATRARRPGGRVPNRAAGRLALQWCQGRQSPQGPLFPVLVALDSG